MQDSKQSELIGRLYICWDQIRDYPNNSARLDLKRMHLTATQQFIECDKELVECRRIGKFTSKYVSLQATFESTITCLEQYITFAMLMS